MKKFNLGKLLDVLRSVDPRIVYEDGVIWDSVGCDIVIIDFQYDEEILIDALYDESVYISLPFHGKLLVNQLKPYRDELVVEVG